MAGLILLASRELRAHLRAGWLDIEIENVHR